MHTATPSKKKSASEELNGERPSYMYLFPAPAALFV